MISALRVHAANDSAKVNLLIKIAAAYQTSNLDSTAFYANEGLDISGELGFERGKQRCMQQLGTAALLKNEFDKAHSYFNEALLIAQKKGDKINEAAIFYSIGNDYYHEAKYNIAIDYFNKSLALSERLNDAKTRGLVLTSMGNVYNDLSNFTQALQYYLKALAILEQEKDIPGISACLSDVASVYAFTGDYPKALDYNNRSLTIFERTGNKAGVLQTMLNVGIVYGQMKDYKNALASFEKGIEISGSMKDEYWRSICLDNIAECYYFMGSYDTAFAKYTEALQRSEQTHDMNNMAQEQNGIGRVLIKKGKVAEGISHLSFAFHIVQQNGMKEPAFEIATDLSDAYEQLHDYSHALQYHKIAYNYRDSLYNDKNDKRIQQLQFDYELGKKEDQIKLLEKDKIIERKIEETQRVTLVGLTAGLALLVVISILLYRSRTYEKHGKEMILKQKEEIEKQTARLESLNQFKDKAFSVLSHDLRGPIFSFTSTIELLDEHSISPEEFVALKPLMVKQLNSLNILLDNLLKWAKASMEGQVTARPISTGLYGIARQNVTILQGSVDAKHITLHNGIPPSIQAFCDPAQMDIVIRNLLMNAIKYSNQHGTISLAAKSENSKVLLTFADNGVGMTQEQMDKLFTPIPDNTTYGTAGEKGTGLGLLLCYDFIKANNGTISVVSELGKGSTFTVVLPANALA